MRVDTFQKVAADLALAADAITAVEQDLSDHGAFFSSHDRRDERTMCTVRLQLLQAVEQLHTVHDSMLMLP